VKNFENRSTLAKFWARVRCPVFLTHRYLRHIWPTARFMMIFRRDADMHCAYFSYGNVTGWVAAGCLSVTAGIVSKRLNLS